MITRYALFEGTVAPGQTEAFRAAVLDEILPVWRRFPGALAIHVTFALRVTAGTVAGSIFTLLSAKPGNLTAVLLALAATAAVAEGAPPQVGRAESDRLRPDGRGGGRLFLQFYKDLARLCGAGGGKPVYPCLQSCRPARRDCRTQACQI